MARIFSPYTLLIQLCLAAAVYAAPIAEANMENAWEYGTSGGIIALIVLILDIIVAGTSEPNSSPLPLYPTVEARRSRGKFMQSH